MNADSSGRRLPAVRPSVVSASFARLLTQRGASPRLLRELRSVTENMPFPAADADELPSGQLPSSEDVQEPTDPLADDLDGGEATETVTFGLDGVSYSIDLSEQNAVNFRAELAEFVSAARRVSRRHPRSERTTSDSDAEAIRAWAKENGYEVTDRARISGEVPKADDQAM